MSGEPTITRVGGSFDEILLVLEDLDERVRDRERQSRLPPSSSSVASYASYDKLPNPNWIIPEWAFAVEERRWFRAQRDSRSGTNSWVESDPPTGFS